MKGFTLLEILLAVGITLIVGILLAGVLVSHNNLFYQQDSLVKSGLSLNDALREIDVLIRQAAAVAPSYIDGPLTYTTGASTLVLKLPSLNVNGDIISNVYDFVVIAPDASLTNILRLQTFPDPQQSSRSSTNQVLTTLLQQIQFTYLDKLNNPVPPTQAASVGITLTVLSKIGSVGSNKSASIVTTLRNY